MLRIGVDTGGTFTDLVLLSGSGITVHKLRSSPDDPSRSILAGIQEMTGSLENAEVVHGSTVATNAVLERRGARVALVATAGFEDVLRIGRQTRRELYNFMVEDRRPLVDHSLTFGVRERLGPDGEELIPLDETELEGLVARLVGLNVEAVAVCLLHSYRSGRHESVVAERLERVGLTVSASHRILPEYREFERWSTTVVNAYVTPLMERYLTALEGRLGHARLSIMQSNGGSISAAAAKAAAVRTILSGPAAGVVGAAAVGAAAGYGRLITFDMGGTSTDVSLVDRAISMTTESIVGDFPVRLPIIDIHTVGAGGGSIAYLDSGDAMRVGPRSAGAEPGPVCYGTGTELTVTDANLLLGRLDPDFFLGGRMTLDFQRTQAVACEFARRLGLTEQALAEGIVRVANANMERAIRVVSVQRGFDPREFALLAFGGAGGMHACEIADKLDITTVIAPRHAGVLSALGTLLADVTKDYSRTILRATTEVTAEELESEFAPLLDQARADLISEGFTGRRVIFERALDVRYIGQSFEITVAFAPGYDLEFDAKHSQLYGYSNPRRPTEIVNLRVKATGITEKPQLPRTPGIERRQAKPATVKPAVFAGRVVPTAFYRSVDLEPGAVGDGPAVLAGAQATTVVPPNFRFRIDEFGSVLAERALARPQVRRREKKIAVGV